MVSSVVPEIRLDMMIMRAEEQAKRERERQEAAASEAKRWSKLTDEQRTRESEQRALALRRQKRREEVSAVLAGAVLLALLFALAVAFIQSLGVPLLAALPFGMIIFLALWVWILQREIAELRTKTKQAVEG